ncbi:MAG: YezD family protein [Candidatus Omnitrophota bacterium]|nr:YezD family protein [Candidatus Omnitrophota bacterium]
MDSKNTTTEDKEKQHIVKEITEAIESVNYGEIIIAIHDSKVVQIEKREKKRFK